MKDYKNIEKYLDLLSKSIYSQKFCKDHIDSTNDTINLIEGSKFVLDVGSGDGYMLDLLKQRGIRAIGLSMNDEDIDICRGKGYEMVKTDMSFLPFEDNTFDCVWACRVIEHSPMPLLTLMEFKRVVKPNGIIVLAIPDDVPALRNHQNHFSVFPRHTWHRFFNLAGLKLEVDSQHQIWDPNTIDYIFKLRKV